MQYVVCPVQYLAGYLTRIHFRSIFPQKKQVSVITGLNPSTGW
jgi:hypothetical protein